MEENKIKVLLIEDDMTLGQILTLSLTSAGFQVHYMYAPIGVVSIISEFHPSIILTDVELGDKNGIDEAKKVLDVFPNIPIIAMSSHVDPSYIKRALESGCKAYLKKPTSLEELVAYVKKYAVPMEFSFSIPIGSVLKLNYEKEELIDTRNNNKYKLSEKECKALLLMKQNQNKLVKRDVFFEKLWIDEIGNDYNLNNIISRIRNVIPKNSGVRIVTVRNSGYMLECF
ncbi:MAG: response regulator transcription factor [Rikenellaceae bacterium]